MKKFKLALIVVVLVLIGVILTGCNKEPVTIESPIQQSTDDEIFEKVIVDVYWDATYSMQGYTAIAADNIYRTLPDTLGDIGSSMGEIKFYRFGANVKLLNGRDYRQFSYPYPYNELITAVHNVIDNADNNHLSIIITDLFESDADWSNVTQKIRDKYFAQHQAAAIIGIKNSFNGDIFDVGLNAEKFTYNSFTDPLRFRPFYLLILGNESTVIDFMQRFKSRQTLPNEIQYLLLSENLIESNDFSKLQIQEMENFFADNQLEISDKHIKELGIDSFNNLATFTINFKYNPPLGACPLDMSALTSNIQIFTMEDGEWQAKSDNDVTIKIVPLEDQLDSYMVKLTLTPRQSLTEGKINFIHASIVPTAKGYQMPEWVLAWNMPNVDVSPANFDGSKTVNLVHVIDSLKDSVFSTAQPTLINLDFVVDAR